LATPLIVLLEDGSRLCTARVADKPWSRMLGLMGQKALPAHEGLLILPCSSVHTHFMRFGLDVVYLDRDDRVVKVVRGLKPWRFSLGGKGAQKVLELTAGSASAGVEPGNKLSFLPAPTGSASKVVR